MRFLIETFGVIIGITLVLALLILGPIGAIWALNTLFGTQIILSLKTWFAVFVLTALISNSSRK